MGDAKIKKFKGNVTKFNYFHAYIVKISFELKHCLQFIKFYL